MGFRRPAIEMKVLPLMEMISLGSNDAAQVKALVEQR